MLVGFPSESVVRMKMDPEGEGAGAGPGPGRGVTRESGGLTNGGGGVGAENGGGISAGGGMPEDGVTTGMGPGNNPVTTSVTGAGVVDPVNGGMETIVNMAGGPGGPVVGMGTRVTTAGGGREGEETVIGMSVGAPGTIGVGIETSTGVK
ncbi:hypothetical protein GP486_008993, partial [Trichoglossum hirsutum]